MNEEGIERIKQDLDTISHALGVEMPFCRMDIWKNIGNALLGAWIVLWTVLEIKGLPYASFGIGAGFLGVVLLYNYVSKKHRDQKVKHPVCWREYRRYQTLLSVAIPALLLFSVWVKWSGMPKIMVAGVSTVLIGLFFMAVPIYDPRRLYFIGGALPAIPLGVVAPFFPAQAMALPIGGWFVLSGLLTAGIMQWQLLRKGLSDAPH